MLDAVERASPRRAEPPCVRSDRRPAWRASWRGLRVARSGSLRGVAVLLAGAAHAAFARRWRRAIAVVGEAHAHLGGRSPAQVARGHDVRARISGSRIRSTSGRRVMGAGLAIACASVVGCGADCGLSRRDADGRREERRGVPAADVRRSLRSISARSRASDDSRAPLQSGAGACANREHRARRRDSRAGGVAARPEGNV